MRLVFANATTFNPAGHPVHEWAKKLSAQFEKEFRRVTNAVHVSSRHVHEVDSDSDDDYRERYHHTPQIVNEIAKTGMLIVSQNVKLSRQLSSVTVNTTVSLTVHKKRAGALNGRITQDNEPS